MQITSNLTPELGDLFVDGPSGSICVNNIFDAEAWIAKTCLAHGDEPNEYTVTRVARPVTVVLMGPQCAGKSHLLDHMVRRHDFEIVPTITTRPPRPGEMTSGVTKFVSSDTFRALLAKGELAEYNVFAGNYYGKLKRDILGVQRHAVMISEPNGYEIMVREMEDQEVVFLPVCVNAKPKIVAERFMKRYETALPEVVATRLAELLEDVQGRFTGRSWMYVDGNRSPEDNAQAIKARIEYAMTK